MSKRSRHRARYIEAWDTMDAEMLLASVAEGFVFDDPADPAPVTKATLVAYMPVWPARAEALGTRFAFEMTDKVVRDEGGILTEWYWWRLAGTEVEGTALIRTGDEGVLRERLTYFRTPWPLRR
jgi:hypothetical protein